MYVPAASGVVGLTDQRVPVRGALSVAASAPDVSAPLKTRTVTVAASPGPSPAEPVSVGKRVRDMKPGPGPVIASAGPMACEPRTHVAADSLLTRSPSAKTALS